MRPPLRPLLASASLLAASLVWGFRLADGATPWRGWSGTLMGADLVLLTAVAIVGMLVAASRWARRLAILTAGAGLAVATLSPVDAWWWTGLATGGASLAALAGSTFKGLVRERPSASGPPAQAVVLTLLLLAAPLAFGLSLPQGAGGLVAVLALAVLAAGAWYAKAAPAALEVARFLVPALLLAGALLSGWPGGIGVAAFGLVVTRFAWTAGARVAVRPLVERGTRVRIPPELAPREILDAAGLDDRGRRRDEG